MKLYIFIALLFPIICEAQDTLVIKPTYSTIILGKDIYNVKISLEAVNKPVAPATTATTPKPTTVTPPAPKPTTPPMMARPVGSYVSKSEYETKMKDVDAKLNNANTAIGELKKVKADTLYFKKGPGGFSGKATADDQLRPYDGH